MLKVRKVLRPRSQRPHGQPGRHRRNILTVFTCPYVRGWPPAATIRAGHVPTSSVRVTITRETTVGALLDAVCGDPEARAILYDSTGREIDVDMDARVDDDEALQLGNTLFCVSMASFLIYAPPIESRRCLRIHCKASCDAYDLKSSLMGRFWYLPEAHTVQLAHQPSPGECAMAEAL
eukprot:336087-Prymnesium_polylepis.1